MKLILLITFIILVSTKSFAQEHQKYSGKFKDGFAEYIYVDASNGERIYNGGFVFDRINFNSKEHITGYFKENRIDSVWKYFRNDTLISTIFFKEGKRTGTWQYSETRKNYNELTKILKVIKVDLSASFKNNNFDGPLTFKYQETENNAVVWQSKVQGKFKNGYLHGKWENHIVTKNEQTSFNDYYLEGVNYFSNSIDQQTGRMTIYVDSNNLLTTVKETIYDHSKSSPTGKYKIISESSSNEDFTSQIIHCLTENQSINVGNIFEKWGFAGWMKDWRKTNSLWGLELQQLSNVSPPIFPLRWLIENQIIEPNKKDEESSEVIKEIFSYVEIMPQFKGDINAYISDKLKRIAGDAVVRFVVTSQGELEEITILRSSTKDFEEKLLEVFRTMPNWEPGKHKEKVVNTYITLTVRTGNNKNRQSNRSMYWSK